MRELAIAIGAVAAALVLVLALLAIAGFPPGLVVATWSAGAWGSGARATASLLEAAPLLWCGLAATVAFRAGALNVGIEGQFLLGAVLAAGVATSVQSESWRPDGPAWLTIIAALGAGAGAGALWAGAAGALERGRGVPLVLATILLNLVAAALASLLIERVFQDPATTAPQTAVLAAGARLPALAAGSRLHLGVLGALLAALALWLVQARSVLGFEAAVAGLNPLAGRLAGIPVARRASQALILSGALGGFAGACQVLGVTHVLSAGGGGGYGYAGIAVALLGRLHPLGAVAAALFFGGLDTGARQLERRAHIPHDLGDMVKGLVVLGVLLGPALAARWKRGP